MLKNLIFLFGFSTFVTIVWISTAVYHSSVDSKISTSIKNKTTAIKPSFDIETLDKLKTRTEIPINLADGISILSPEGLGSSESATTNNNEQINPVTLTPTPSQQ